MIGTAVCRETKCADTQPSRIRAADASGKQTLSARRIGAVPADETRDAGGIKLKLTLLTKWRNTREPIRIRTTSNSHLFCDMLSLPA